MKWTAREQRVGWPTPKECHKLFHDQTIADPSQAWINLYLHNPRLHEHKTRNDTHIEKMIPHIAKLTHARYK